MEPLAATEDIPNTGNDVAMADANVPMQDTSSLPYDLQEKIAKTNAIFKAKCDEKEIPLSAAE